jgi:F-type H+-transporting ATPase subunit delta
MSQGRHVDPLAAVYADALGQVTDERGGEELLHEVGGALSAFGQAWAQDRYLRAYFLSAMVTREKKDAALQKLLDTFPPVLADFVQVMIHHGRGRIIDKVAVAYDAWLDERLGRVPVSLTTATETTDELLEAWKERIRQAMGKEPVLEHHVNPALVAGATLRVGNLVLDGSARKKLADLRQSVMERGTDAIQA